MILFDSKRARPARVLSVMFFSITISTWWFLMTEHTYPTVKGFLVAVCLAVWVSSAWFLIYKWRLRGFSGVKAKVLNIKYMKLIASVATGCIALVLSLGSFHTLASPEKTIYIVALLLPTIFLWRAHSSNAKDSQGPRREEPMDIKYKGRKKLIQIGLTYAWVAVLIILLRVTGVTVSAFKIVFGLASISLMYFWLAPIIASRLLGRTGKE